MFISPQSRGSRPFPSVLKSQDNWLQHMGVNSLGHLKAAIYYDNNGVEVKVNPATEDTLALASTEATLLLIKNTDGIKKIADAVAVTTLKPDGTNTMPSMDAVARPGYFSEVETVPTNSAKTNPSIALTWSSGQLTTIVKTISAVAYTKTLTWSSGQLTAITAWS